MRSYSADKRGAVAARDRLEQSQQLSPRLLALPRARRSMLALHARRRGLESEVTAGGGSGRTAIMHRPPPAGARPANREPDAARLRSGHQHRVDDVDDAVRLHHVGDRDLRLVALGVDDPPSGSRSCVNISGSPSTVFRVAVPLLSRGHRRDLLRRDPARDHMVGQDLVERRLVLGLDQGFDGARGQLRERRVGRREDGERPLAGQRVDQARLP